MLNQLFYKLLTYLLAGVWFINGFYCKVLNQVPRHKLIIARILGADYAGLFTLLIGLSEIGLAFWILVGYKSRISAGIQIILVATMNIIEYFLVPDLLLFGRLNALFAFLFIMVVYFKEFRSNRNWQRT